MRDLEHLWVLYDASCGFCCRSAEWLNSQEKLVGLTCLASDSAAARIFAPIQRPNELVVIDSNGGVYRDEHAFLMALWALTAWRAWAERLAQSGLQPQAHRLLHFVSSRRKAISDLLRLKPDAEIARQIAELPTEQCTEDSCPRPAIT